jgi:biotin carboxylase
MVGVSASDRSKRLLVLGAGPAQLGVLRAARARGLYVVACDRDPQAPGFEFADRRAVVSTEDEPAIGMLASAEQIDGVIAPGIDWPVAIAARIAARFGLPHPISPESAAVAVSKQRQRERLEQAGVPQPRWRVAIDARDLTVPCVVKPPDRQGQKGLTVVRDEAQLEDAVRTAIGASRGGAALVEELVEGPEVTVNAFSSAGKFQALTVTDRLTAEPPAFGVALAHVWPSEHDAEAAVEAARSAAEALGVRSGPTYTQVRLGRDGARVVELAARLGGGHDAELCQAATGVDLNGLALDFALTGSAKAPSDTVSLGAAGACVVFLVAPIGRLMDVSGAVDAQAIEGVEWVRVYRRPGWEFGPLRRGGDRAGAVLAVAESREQALERARRAAEAVRFGVDADTA